MVTRLATQTDTYPHNFVPVHTVAYPQTDLVEIEDPTPMPTMREDDLQQHIEDDFLYTAIRNNRFVQLPWNELTECERRDIHVSLNCIY